MQFRILATTLVLLGMLSAGFFALVWASMSLIPADFGMPEYEHEVEWAVLVGSAAVTLALVPVCVKVLAPLGRRPESQPQSAPTD